MVITLLYYLKGCKIHVEVIKIIVLRYFAEIGPEIYNDKDDFFLSSCLIFATIAAFESVKHVEF